MKNYFLKGFFITFIVTLAFSAYIEATNVIRWYEWSRYDFILLEASGYFSSLRKPYREPYTLTIKQESNFLRVSSDQLKKLQKDIRGYKEKIYIKYHPSGTSYNRPIEITLENGRNIYKAEIITDPWVALVSLVGGILLFLMALSLGFVFYKNILKVEKIG